MTVASACEVSHSFNHNPFLLDVLEGLSASQKQLSPKYFYDELGSQYFDEICALSEYYPYQTELTLLERVASDLAEDLTDTLTVVEFGAGSLKKIEPLLRKLDNIESFMPIDISGGHLQQSAERLGQTYPQLSITPMQADFTETVSLAAHKNTLLGFFPGSTIGNFDPAQALQFLRNARATLNHNGRLLIGVDTKKPVEILHRAYNDSLGVTAKFNLNILERINKELDGDIDTQLFEHYAFYNPIHGCIQMHLISLATQHCSVSGHQVAFSKGESIHTENSYKYTPEQFQVLAESAGWAVEHYWLADDNMFSTFLLRNPDHHTPC